MAPRKKSKTSTKTSKTMASDYEQQREENIRRNREMISSLLLHQKSSDLSSLLSPSKTPAKKVAKRPIKNPIITPRRSLRSRGLPPDSKDNSISTPRSPEIPLPTQFSFADSVKMHSNPDSYQTLVKTICAIEERIEELSICEKNFDLRTDLGLKNENVRTVFGERIMLLRFLPVSDREIIVSGNKQGLLGFWDVGLESENKDADDVFVFFPHRRPVSGISFHPNSIRKMYSSCYGGDLCLMDIEKEMFNIIYSSDYPIFSLCQSPNNHNLLYLGLDGQVNSFDDRENKICNMWELHEKRINTIDFHPQNSNLILTSSTDGFARIWDLRNLNKIKCEKIFELKHNRAVHSAYFSPTGTSLVSTSIDDTIRISSGSNFDNQSVIHHNNQTGRWLSSFRATWGWSDKYILIGNMKRAIDVISTNDNATTSIQSENMTNIPCRFAINPYKEGHLACAGGGKIYLWTEI
ncbi:hypothetical protein LUZ60_008906 [Juncus effusus]|nr:hypothetical protein LUZ60_008906 [Juncus effusus]